MSSLSHNISRHDLRLVGASTSSMPGVDVRCPLLRFDFNMGAGNAGAGNAMCRIPEGTCGTFPCLDDRRGVLCGVIPTFAFADGIILHLLQL